jgi:GNAT superfamily N-acetyltransferase
VDLLPEMFVGEKAGFLADIYVIPSQRSKGTGRALVEALKGWFRARDIQHFEWYVAHANPAAVAFWRAIGGSEVILRMRASTQEGE